MADNNKDQNANQGANNVTSPFVIHDQYIKDLSFENPNYLLKYSEKPESPKVTVNVETNVTKIQDNTYEVTMKMTLKGQTEEKKGGFLMEMAYGALVTVDPKLKEDVLEPILIVHCPFLMFPFARSIVADVTRFGGYPPLLIDPIDFAALYVAKKQQQQQNEQVEKPDVKSANSRSI
jgi:preprotein translocase subunit SecB